MTDAAARAGRPAPQGAAAGPAGCAARGRLDGTLEQVRELLDRALAAERRRCSPTRTTRPGWPRRSWTRCRTTPARAVRELSDYQWRSRRGPAGVRGDQGPAAPGGAGQPVPRDAGRAARRRPGGHGPDPGDDRRAQRACSRPTPAASTPGRSSTVHGRVRRVLPGEPGRTSTSWSTRWPAGRPPQQRLMDSPVPEQRQELAELMARRDGRRRAGRRDGAAAASSCGRPGRTCAGAAGSGCDGDRPLGLGDATGALAGDRRPGRARRDARPGLPGRLAGRHRRGAGGAGARPAGGRRPGGAAPDRAGAAAAGLPQPRRRPAGADAAGGAAARGDRAAPGVLGARTPAAAATTTCGTRARPAS